MSRAVKSVLSRSSEVTVQSTAIYALEMFSSPNANKLEAVVILPPGLP